MVDILKSILSKLPKSINDASFEGANIVLYTYDRDFFQNSNRAIREIVKEIKKRVELRADEKILLGQEETEKIVRDVVPKEAEITNLIFDVQRSVLIVEAKKPGIVIGKQGSVL